MSQVVLITVVPQGLDTIRAAVDAFRLHRRGDSQKSWKFWMIFRLL